MQFEWLIIELIVLGLAIYELASLYRKDRSTKPATKPPSPPGSGHTEGQERLHPGSGETVE